MKKTWLFMSIILSVLITNVFAQQNCIPRSELRDKHVMTYQSYNGSTRGCVVSPRFYTEQHKKGRGNLSRKFIIEVCEGEPRTSPRVGNSFEICRYYYNSNQNSSTPE